MDICPNCEFVSIRPYTPSVNAIELLRSGFSSLDLCETPVLNDITNLEQELQKVEFLLMQIRDRHDRLLKDLGDCKALLAPIRRLPQETLLQIFGFASSDSPIPHDPLWSLGQVCSTWRSISRSCPSLWTKICFTYSSVSDSNTGLLMFLEEYISLSRNLPIDLSVEYAIDEEMMQDFFNDLVVHSERWASVELNVYGEWFVKLMSPASSPATRLTKLCIYVYDVDEALEHDRAVVAHNIFSSSPIREAHLQGVPYSCLPINMTELREFHVYSYDPAELHSMFRQAEHLIQFVITLAAPLQDIVVNLPPSTYTHINHNSLKRLSFTLTYENITEIPATVDYITLPALQQFDILARNNFGLYIILQRDFEPFKFPRLIDLFHRSNCNLTSITLSVPVSVEAFLVPIIAQSPALQKLDIFIDASIGRDVFRALVFEQGAAQHLKELCVKEIPMGLEDSALLEDAEGLHAMILSRSDGNHRLDALRLSLDSEWADHQSLSLPVAEGSPFHDLFRIKDQGVAIEFLVDGEDCLVYGEAHFSVFGSSSLF